jgi:hypothetical protein
MQTIRHLPLAHPVLAESERQRCEIWTRVMGYHRPVSSFNTGKKGEFAERVYFREAAVASSQAGVLAHD